MNDKERLQKPIDPLLVEKLNLLGPTPLRDEGEAARGRERYLAELEGLPATSSPESSGWLAGIFRQGNGGGNSVRLFNRKFALSTVLVMILVAIMLFGGASATAFASQSSLPGDALYPLKMGLEQTQISLANDAYTQAKLYLELARRRMDEIKGLLAQGRSSDVEFASNEFEFLIQQALEATNTVIATDPERGAELSSLVSQALLDYAVTLKAVLLEAPDPVKPVVEKVLLLSQDGAGDELEIFGVVESISEQEIWIEGEVYLVNDLTEFEDVVVAGDSVKIHAILTPEGTMFIREIELSDIFDEDFPRLENDNSNEAEPGDDENSDSDNNENESEDNSNDNESNENENENEAEDDLNENESDDDENENKSEDSKNENKSEDNENKSDDDDNENKSDDNDNENSNESEAEQEEEDKEHNDNGD